MRRTAMATAPPDARLDSAQSLRAVPDTVGKRTVHT